MTTARITRAAGALVEAQPIGETGLFDLAYVGDHRLLAEVVRVEGETGTLQVYEDTTGLCVGDSIELAGRPLTVELGPGLLGSVLDGIGRPISRLAESSGDFLAPGTSARTLDATRRWTFTPAAAPGDAVEGGDVLGTVQEGGLVHRVLVPPAVAGTIRSLETGEFSVDDPIGALEDGTALHLTQAWPVRSPRPIAERLTMDRPFITGQRVFDFLFPIAEGGNAAVPGGFGTGKTIIEQSLAKFAETDIVVFVGCGERGNEMAELLSEFPALEDPRTGRPLMERTVLIVNTSNMPVAARETSMYLGVTVAEFYRDMGYRVALMIDSASRWAEALREIAARLQEMPGEEGYPTYLASRLGRFFERAGRVRALGAPEREGSVTIIGAISPPGGDFSEPVTQAALRVTGALWSLDASLAHQRHFPAVDWETSYTLYADALTPWFARELGSDWAELRAEVTAMLQRERELRDIAALVGPESLADADRFDMAAAAMVREIVLRQNAYHPVDRLSSGTKTYALATAARLVRDAGREAIERGASAGKLDLTPVKRALAAMRDAPDEELAARLEEVRRAAAAMAPAGGPE